jgi:hypothetical protein
MTGLVPPYNPPIVGRQYYLGLNGSQLYMTSGAHWSYVTQSHAESREHVVLSNIILSS